MWNHPATLRGLSSWVWGFNTTTRSWGGPARWDASSAPSAATCRCCGRLARPRPPTDPRVRANGAGPPRAEDHDSRSPESQAPHRGSPVSPIPPRHAQRRKAERGEPPSRGLWTIRGGVRRGGLRTGCPRLAGPWRPRLQWKIFRSPTEAARRGPRPFPPGASARVPPAPGERPRPRPALLRKPRPPPGKPPPRSPRP